MPKIAVIEDDFAIQNMYKLKLTQEGFEVRVANNGQIGLELTKKFMPDIILLDLRMPVMNGEEMLRNMRSTDWGGSIRVIVLTNISRSEAPSALRVLNVDRYIVKAHTTPAEVVRIIREVIDTPKR